MMSYVYQILLEQHGYLDVSLWATTKPSFHHLWRQFAVSIPFVRLELEGILAHRLFENTAIVAAAQ